MDLRAVAEIDLESERCDATTVRSLALKSRDAAGGRAAHDRSRGDGNWNCIERVLKRESLRRAECASITKRRDEKLSIRGFVVVQTPEDRRRRGRKTTPEAKLVVTTF